MNQIPYNDGRINTCDHLLTNGQQAWKRLREKDEIINPQEHFESAVLKSANDAKACSFLFICTKCREVKQVIELVLRYELTTQYTPEPQVPTRELDREWEKEKMRKIA